MDTFIKKVFYTIGTLKTNRVLYLCGIKQKVSELALHLRKTDSNINLVTVGSRSYYVHWHEGNLNSSENAVVLIKLSEGCIPCLQSPAYFYQYRCFLKHPGESGYVCGTLAGGSILPPVQGQPGI